MHPSASSLPFLPDPYPLGLPCCQHLKKVVLPSLDHNGTSSNDMVTLLIACTSLTQLGRTCLVRLLNDSMKFASRVGGMARCMVVCYHQAIWCTFCLPVGDENILLLKVEDKKQQQVALLLVHYLLITIRFPSTVHLQSKYKKKSCYFR
jgi:hypothetical protein